MLVAAVFFLSPSNEELLLNEQRDGSAKNCYFLFYKFNNLISVSAAKEFRATVMQSPSIILFI